ncbi:MAG: DNA-3-methyladenine glycosylase 2 family protein [Flavisolibacter sp.]|nr:DNA-3-methyladenine glycosylase 2 family protein [Flavisolibacter sp.]
MIQKFNKDNFHSLCDELGERDEHLKHILHKYGYPPFWNRSNTFETLVLTILEQQVSLASAYAAYKKLKEKVSVISPSSVIALNDDELKACYFSRQKITYVRELANHILGMNIILEDFENTPDDKIRTKLKKLKGIGDWTVDIYLIHALQRADVFPIGDLDLVKGMVMAKNIKTINKIELFNTAKKWQPYRSIATMIFWHYYIKEKKIKLSY